MGGNPRPTVSADTIISDEIDVVSGGHSLDGRDREATRRLDSLKSETARRPGWVHTGRGTPRLTKDEKAMPRKGLMEGEPGVGCMPIS